MADGRRSMTNYGRDYMNRCVDCGRYVGWTADSYIPWGCADPEAPEPYDPEYLCERCAHKRREKVVEQLVREGIPVPRNRPYYYTPGYWHDAASLVKALRRRGLVSLPTRHEEARYEWPWMPNCDHARVWCTCGWNSDKAPEGVRITDAVREHRKEVAA